jgi:hypothetical protein
MESEESVSVLAVLARSKLTMEDSSFNGSVKGGRGEGGPFSSFSAFENLENTIVVMKYAIGGVGW